MIEKASCATLVSKKRYVDVVQKWGREVKDARQKSEFDRHKVAEHDRQIVELSLKVQLLAEDS